MIALRLAIHLSVCVCVCACRHCRCCCRLLNYRIVPSRPQWSQVRLRPMSEPKCKHDLNGRRLISRPDLTLMSPRSETSGARTCATCPRNVFVCLLVCLLACLLVCLRASLTRRARPPATAAARCNQVRHSPIKSNATRTHIWPVRSERTRSLIWPQIIITHRRACPGNNSASGEACGASAAAAAFLVGLGR